MGFSFDDFSQVPDLETDNRLLPELFHHSDNQEELAYCKVAMRHAMEHCLDKSLQELLHRVYWRGEAKQDIAAGWNLSPSTITRRLEKAESVLRRYVEFALATHRNFEYDKRNHWS